ncbi:MAG: AmmeMemoRadiSam system protein A [Bacillota bacterium]
MVLGACILPHPPILLPEVGRGEERRIQATADAYREAARRIAQLKPDTVVLASPHATLYADYFHISPGRRAEGDMRQFRAPGVTVNVEYDEALVKAIADAAKAVRIPAGTLGERERALDHGTVIPLRFLDEAGLKAKVVRMGLSGLSPLMHYRLGACVVQAAQALGRSIIFVASGDLSHKLSAEGPYGFAPEGPRFDREITKAMADGDFLKFLSFDPDFAEAAAECGLRSCMLLAGVLDGLAVKPELLSYEGPFGVGYAVAAFEVTGTDESRRFGEAYERQRLENAAKRKANEDPYVRLARYSLETYIKTGERAALPDNIPEELLKTRAGAFVSLKLDGRLRGCIGTTEPTKKHLAAEILQNAVSAGTEDPRFDPVTEEELPALTYSVDVLGEAEPIDSETELDVKRYGVIVSAGYKRGLLLPDLAGVDTVREQVDIARHKAGIREGEPVKLQRFEVVRHV